MIRYLLVILFIAVMFIGCASPQTGWNGKDYSVGGVHYNPCPTKTIKGK
jgi:hypothetical protein